MRERWWWGSEERVSVSTYYYLPYNRFTDSSQARQSPAVDDPRVPLAAPPSTKVAEGSAPSSSTLHLLSSGRTGRLTARSASEPRTDSTVIPGLFLCVRRNCAVFVFLDYFPLLCDGFHKTPPARVTCQKIVSVWMLIVSTCDILLLLEYFLTCS